MGLAGLGLVVRVSSEFDPGRMKERYTHWLNVVVDEIAGQARQGIKEGKMKVDENPTRRTVLMRQALRNFTPIKSTSIGGTWGYSKALKSPSQTKMIVKSIGTLAIGYVLPWVGIALAITGMFGPKKKMPMPWETIFTQAVPYARQLTEQEEVARIQEEKERIKYERMVEVKRQSEQATQFKLPENVTSVTKGGVVMLKTKGGPVETRIEAKK